MCIKKDDIWHYIIQDFIVKSSRKVDSEVIHEKVVDRLKELGIYLQSHQYNISINMANVIISITITATRFS